MWCLLLVGDAFITSALIYFSIEQFYWFVLVFVSRDFELGRNVSCDREESTFHSFFWLIFRRLISEVTERISTRLGHKFNPTSWRDTANLIACTLHKDSSVSVGRFQAAWRIGYDVVKNFTFAISCDVFLVVILTQESTPINNMLYFSSEVKMGGPLWN